MPDRREFLAFSITGCIASLLAACATTGRTSMRMPSVRAHGMLLVVPSIAEAQDFMENALGFKVAYSHSGFAELSGKTPIFLAQGNPDAPDENLSSPRAQLVLQTADLIARQAELKAKGVTFLGGPVKNGVGISSYFIGPGGIRYSLLEQQVVQTPPFSEPKVYNYGYSHKNVAEIRSFYVDRLGFVVRTEQYFPPALPLGHDDGAFGFMLHERPELSIETLRKWDGSGANVVFSTDDLTSARAVLEAAGLAVRPLARSKRGGRQGFAFRDPTGVISEIWSIE